jgi:hypothetical protein
MIAGSPMAVIAMSSLPAPDALREDRGRRHPHDHTHAPDRRRQEVYP